jgi:hypothetical protein
MEKWTHQGSSLKTAFGPLSIAIRPHDQKGYQFVPKFDHAKSVIFQ